MFECTLKLKSGIYDYKFIVDGNWILDDFKFVNSEGNHFLNVCEEKIIIYPNICQIRKVFNSFQKKLFEEYPEVYPETNVI